MLGTQEKVEGQVEGDRLTINGEHFTFDHMLSPVTRRVIVQRKEDNRYDTYVRIESVQQEDRDHAPWVRGDISPRRMIKVDTV